jgi:hypothetical protein
MFKSRLGILLAFLLGVVATPGVTVRAQNFGGVFQRKQIVLVRKLPPTGHIDGSTFTVKVAGAVQGDVVADLKSTLESVIVSNDPRLRSVTEGEKPDAVINIQVTAFAEAQQYFTQPGISFSKKPAPAQPMTHVTGMLTGTFAAQDTRAHRSIDANSASVKYDREFALPQPATGGNASWGTILGSLPGGKKEGPGEGNQPPTPVELKNWLVQSAAMQIASHLVNTSEQLKVLLATGGGLDDADKLMEQKLWTRALEGLETMTPFPQPEADAYRLYDLGVANEALGYQAEDVVKARKYLQEASIDYGKAIDAKPAEKYFLEPQTRIDTALAHYKTLGDQMAASTQSASAAAAPAADALTNADVISMVGAKLDEGNIIDTIQHSSAVNFELSARGQIDLAKGNVNGRIIAAMKQKARGAQ